MPHPSLRTCILAAALAWLLALVGCATNNAGPKTGYFIVTEPTAEFFKYGPAQSFGPDLMLKKGDRVTMLERNWGFSKVLTANGVSGYVATENLEPAPPSPASATGGAAVPIGGSRGGMSSSRQNRIRGEVLADPNDPLFNVNDVPLPVLDEPPSKSRPQFRTTTPAPQQAPGGAEKGKPKFR